VAEGVDLAVGRLLSVTPATCTPRDHDDAEVVAALEAL